MKIICYKHIVWCSPDPDKTSNLEKKFRSSEKILSTDDLCQLFCSF